MSFKKIISIFIVSSFAAAAVCGCSQAADSQTADEAVTAKSSESSETKSSQAVSEDSSDEMFTARDKEIGYEESECETITLADNASASSLKSVKIDGNIITVSEEGTYIVTGTLSDGQIIVDGDKKEKIRLILDGVNINSNTSAPIYIKQTDKCFLTLAENSINILTNNKKFTADSDNNVDSVVFSKEDLTLNGNGSLDITTNCGHGIVTKDDLKITSGTYTINSSGHSLCGKDSVRIGSGTFTLVSDKDGIHSENSEDTSLGFIYIAGGTFKITCDGDGMDASGYLTIKDGSVSVKSGGGADNAEKKHEEFGRMDTASTTESETASAKGIKADGTLTISSGTINLDCADDGVHSNSDIKMTSGTLNVKTGDDGMHADNSLEISDGTVNVTESYEGIEALEITVSGGTISVVASDDGFNAAGGNDESGYGGQMPQDSFSSGSDGKLSFSGGKVTVDAQGDGLDSNGSLYVSGGEIYVTGPSNNGNGALDYDNEAVISGGVVIATGMSGMAQNFGSSSVQGSILCNTASTVSGEVVLKDSDGNTIASFTPTREYNSVVVSTPSVKKGSTYTLSMAGTETTIEMTDIIYGESSQMGGGFGDRDRGQGGPNGQPPQSNENGAAADNRMS